MFISPISPVNSTNIAISRKSNVKSNSIHKVEEPQKDEISFKASPAMENYVKVFKRDYYAPVLSAYGAQCNFARLMEAVRQFPKSCQMEHYYILNSYEEYKYPIRALNDGVRYKDTARACRTLDNDGLSLPLVKEDLNQVVSLVYGTRSFASFMHSDPENFNFVFSCNPNHAPETLYMAFGLDYNENPTCCIGPDSYVFDSATGTMIRKYNVNTKKLEEWDMWGTPKKPTPGWKRFFGY